MSLPRVIRLIKLPAIIAAALAFAYGAWSALVDAAGPNRLIVPVKVEHAAKVEIFYDAGQGIRAEDSASEIVAATDELREVAFPVPRVPLKAVRFDPMDAAGKFTVGQPRLETASGRFVAKFPMTALVPVNQIAEFRVEGKQGVGTTTAGANDPQLEFKLGAPLRVGGPRIPWIEGVALLLVAFLIWRFQEPGPASVAKDA